MEARVLGAVLRAESTVQGRFCTALPQFVTAGTWVSAYNQPNAQTLDFGPAAVGYAIPLIHTFEIS